MKRSLQKTGIRKYFGDDLIELQSEPLAAIDAMLAAAGPCVVNGCEVTVVGDKFNLAPGHVALQTTDQATGAVRIMAMPFDGALGVALPVYLVADWSVVERVYKDGAVKPIAYTYKATATAIKPAAANSIEITASYVRRLPDALAESLAKYITVTATEKAVWTAKETPAGAQAKATAAKAEAIATAATDATSKATAAKAEAIATAATDATSKATAAKDVAIATAATDATSKATAAKDVAIATAATDATSKATAAKAEAIAAAATYADSSKYTHPDNTNTRHVTDAEKEAWNSKVNAEAYNGMQSRRDSEVDYDAVSVSPDGVMLMRGRDSSSIAPVRITFDGITAHSNPSFSMPGFLCRMRYLAGGSLVDRYGPKSVNLNAVRVGVGRYKVYHSISNQLYTPAPIPIVSLNGRNVYLPCLIEKGYDTVLNLHYTVIGFSDSSNGNWLDVGFEITFNGQN